MPIEIREKLNSREVTNGANPSAVLRYDVLGTDSDVLARQAVEVYAPTYYDFTGDGSWRIYRESVSVEPVSEFHWLAVVSFGPYTPTNESSFSFETGGGTQHITQSLGTRSYGESIGDTPLPAPDHQGAIGVTDNGVEGVDVIVPVYNFAETHYFPAAFVTPAYKATLAFLTGRVNNAVFRGFEAGEVLFQGASGNKRGAGDWAIDFRFAASPNVSGIQIGAIENVVKYGWEYLWVQYEDRVDFFTHKLVKAPVAAYAEMVHYPGDFSGLGIG